MSDFINTVDLIGDEALTDSIIDRSIIEIMDNHAKKIGNFAFQYCEALTTANFPAVTSIGSNAFQYCEALTIANFPAVTSIGSNAFQYCEALTTANFPAVTSISMYAFYECYKLITVNFPAVTSITNSMLRYCKALTTANFPAVTSIAASAFRNCSALTTLILRGATMCTLANTNAFTSTPIASGTGYIYVPSALVDTYKTATNWSTYANQFRALEDYTVDGTITGELDTTKI